MKNVTEVTMFVLKGFTENPELQIILFFLFLVIYLFTLMGNLGLIVLVIGDSRLHNPMYYFLSVLSSVDACCSSVITPNMLVDFLSQNKVISLLGCATQMFLAVILGPQNASSWLQWLMIAMWQSTTPCCTQSACHPESM